MIDLSKIAAPAELCKSIPEGKFTDSELEYVVWSYDGETRINCIPRVMRNEYASMMPGVFAYIHQEFPAPTLQEILREIKNAQDFLRFGYDNEYGWGAWDDNDRVEWIDNPAAAALKIWLNNSTQGKEN